MTTTNNQWKQLTDLFIPLLTPTSADQNPANQNKNHAGGALVVYHQGECVVNSSVGHSQQNTPWTTDTLSLNFSTGKGVLATLVHCLVSQGLLDYDKPIAHYWAEFANNGKEHITLRQLMSHQANLFAIDSIINDAESMLDWQLMVQQVAQMSTTDIKTKASFTYSTAYSALVYGWILGALIIKVSKLSLQQALDRYLAQPLGIVGQIYFSLPSKRIQEVAQPERNFTQADASKPNRRQKPTLKADSEQTLQLYQRLPCYQQWQALHYQLTGQHKDYLNTADINRLYFNPSLLNLANYKSALMPNAKQSFDYYATEALQATMPAVNCIASAQALAKIYNMLAQGGCYRDGHGTDKQLIDTNTFREMGQIQSTGADAIMPAIAPNSMLWRLGYHRVFSRCHDINHGFGHTGYNGSMAWCDPSRGLAVAFIHNIDTIMLNDIRALAINEMVLDCVN